MWNLSRDVSPNVLAANPHADSLGNEGVWHFYTEPVKESDTGTAIPVDSLLARWHSAASPADRAALAEQLQRLLAGPTPDDPKRPDTVLYQQLTSLAGPLFALARETTVPRSNTSEPTNWGLPVERFGVTAAAAPIEATTLAIAAPEVLEVRLPADLVAGMEFVASAVVDEQANADSAVQLFVGVNKPAVSSGLRSDAPVLVREGSAAQKRFEQAFDDFRAWFPRALCYVQIVPVDEVVTLTLFHREDEPLCRLMLDDAERARLDRLWSELHFVSYDALTLVDAFAQLMEYATQDSDPKLFEPYRKPIYDRAAAFRQELIDAEAPQLDALVKFAARAFRRPLADPETIQLRQLYQKLRDEQLPHDEAFRFTLAKLLVSPEFLYRAEEAPPGASPAPVSDWQLASRLSYFLWSSMPDSELADAAASGRLHEPAVLVAQARRMLTDDRIRRLASEFACQWLQVYDFDTLDEKSESHYPEFATLRSDMYEESRRFFTDLFQRDSSVLDIFTAQYVLVNEPLAAFYGIPDVKGAEWRRVDGAGQYGRGGILALATTLAKNSGALRTSPTLRGNWVSEVLLGEKLPKPPKDVPQLPEEEPGQGLTVRQMVEKHASDARCASCHVRIDPLGFALEGYDTIGRRRPADSARPQTDVQAKLRDGTELDGIDGLRNYLVTTRRDTVVRQFSRKLLGFALGRSVQLSDEPLLDEIGKGLAEHDYKFSAAVETIVLSKQFREIRGKDSQFADAP